MAAAIALAQDCAPLVRQRQPAARAPWLQRAPASTLEALHRFAKGRHDAYAAVKAGVPRPWSQGPGEGHMHRLTRLQRHRCGRARLALLSRRCVGAPRDGPAQAACLRTLAQASPAAAAPRVPVCDGGRGGSRSRGALGRVEAAGTMLHA